MSDKITKYVASDGVEVALSTSNVMRYILTGDNNVADKEVMSFIAKCKARKLNPFAGDAYLTAFNGKASVIVSKDYFVRTATQQPTFDGMKAGIAVVNNGELIYREGSMLLSNEQLVGGWADVYDKERKYPSHAEVSLKEYDKGRSTWKAIPATMIRKTALVQALREAYPASYGGIYDADEMPEPDVSVSAPEPVEVIAEVVPEPEPEPVVKPDLAESDIEF